MTYTTTCRQTGNKRKNGNSGANVKHNLRMCEKSERIYDPLQPPEVFIHIPLKKAYEEVFGAALAEYNDKQKRDDRKIKNYLEKIDTDKQKNTFYEFIFSMGKMEQKELNPTEYKKDAEKLHDVCKDIAENFEKQNPHMKVIGAYWHSDEQGVSHMHLDYIPIATDCKRGLRTQNSIHQAIEQMGYKDTPILDESGQPKLDEHGKPMMKNKVQIWCERVADDFNTRLKAKGIQIEKADKHGRGFNISKKVYKEIAAEVERKIETETKGVFRKTPTERAELMQEIKEQREQDRTALQEFYPVFREQLSDIAVKERQAESDTEKAERLMKRAEQEKQNADAAAQQAYRNEWEKHRAEVNELKRQKKENEDKIAEQGKTIQANNETLQKQPEQIAAGKRKIDADIENYKRQSVRVIDTQIETYKRTKLSKLKSFEWLSRLTVGVFGLIKKIKSGRRGENDRIRNYNAQSRQQLYGELRRNIGDRDIENNIGAGIQKQFVADGERTFE